MSADPNPTAGAMTPDVDLRRRLDVARACFVMGLDSQV